MRTRYSRFATISPPQQNTGSGTGTVQCCARLWQEVVHQAKKWFDGIEHHDKLVVTRRVTKMALACVRRRVATDSRRRDALLQAATLERAQPRRRIALSRAFLRWRLMSVDPAVLASRVSAASLLVVYIIMVG